MIYEKLEQNGLGEKLEYARMLPSIRFRFQLNLVRQQIQRHLDTIGLSTSLISFLLIHQRNHAITKKTSAMTAMDM